MYACIGYKRTSSAASHYRCVRHLAYHRPSASGSTSTRFMTLCVDRTFHGPKLCPTRR